MPSKDRKLFSLAAAHQFHADPAQISALLNKIHSVASLADDCEVTFESSIYDLSADKLAACIAGGVNQFSSVCRPLIRICAAP